MADRLRIVERDGPRRPTVVLDLQDGEGYRLTRDTFAITPPAPKVRTVQSGDRYGGSQAVGATHENATLAATWLVKGATVDEALRKAEALVAQAESALSAPWRYVEWKSEFATHPTYWQRRGPAAWTPTYRWVQMTQARSWEFQITWPVAPLAEWDSLDILDDFSTDSVGDYVFDIGAMVVSGGALTPGTAGLKEFHHVARGYRYEDVQITATYGVNSAPTGSSGIGLRVKRLDASNFLWADLVGGNLRIVKFDGGAATVLNTAAVTPPSATNTYWMRLRVEGNLVTVEHWTTAPTPMGAPANVVTHTLTGANATKFGVGVSGDVGGRMYFEAANLGWYVDDLAVRPFTYRDRALPDKLVLGGAIPGTAPALCDVEITPSGGAAAPVFALLGWNNNKTNDVAAYYPFGPIDSSALTANGLTTTTDTEARGGDLLTANTGSLSSPQGPYITTYLHMMEPDEFTPDELALEVWARVRIASTVANPRLTVSAVAGQPVAPPRAYAEGYESLGKPLTPPSSGTAYRFVRVGVIRLHAHTAAPYRLDAQFSWGGGSSGLVGLDYLFVVPARRRAASPTGKPLGTSYPKFLATTSQQLRRIAADLTGWLAAPDSPYLGAYRAPGLGGSQITLTPTVGAGRVHLAAKLSSLVPDDPTVDATTEQNLHQAAVHAVVTPRSFVARG